MIKQMILRCFGSEDHLLFVIIFIFYRAIDFTAPV